MTTFSRRKFLKASGAAAALPAAVSGATATRTSPSPVPHSRGHASGGEEGLLFLSAAEAAILAAAVDRLIPPDSLGPSATEAGVVTYIDRQLAGAWGAGERLYRAGPWHPGTPQQGYQLPFTPAELFRNALRGIARKAKDGTAFEKLPGREQDAMLTRWQSGGEDLEGVPSKVFFESLLSLAIEGYFSDPTYGGNREMRAWEMIGFPGAYGNYYELVDQYGIAFDLPPRSLAQDGRGHVHVVPKGTSVATPKGKR